MYAVALDPKRIAEIRAWLDNPPPKTCNVCNKTKPHKDFASAQEGSICKVCYNNKRRIRYAITNGRQQKEYYDTHREERRQYNIEHVEAQRWYRWERNSLNWAIVRNFEIVERVQPKVVCERDKWLCWCGEPVNPNLDRETHPMGATIDHIQPIHSYATVRLAHRACNSSIKGCD